MSNKSSSHHKKHSQGQKHPPRANQPTHAKHSPHHAQAKKERGGWLTAAIIVVILHGLLGLGIIFGDNFATGRELPPTWFILSMVGAAIADIVAGIALWRWKKWGLTLYLIATIVVISLGILATGYAMMWAFSRLLPFVIIGYIIRSRWKYFE